MSGLPGGVVTFLFGDIEGSTGLVKALRERYAQVLAEYRRLVRAAVAAHGGQEVDTAGDGFFVAFGGATRAVVCALDVQRALAAYRWPGGAAVRVRIGVHTGQAVLAGGGYTGVAVHRAARICAVARGGQVLVSQATQAVVEDQEEELGFTLVDAGEYRLTGLDRPVRLFALAAPGLDPAGAAGGEAESAAGGVHGFPAALTSFIGRAGPVAEVAGLLAGYRLVTVTGPGGSGKTRLAGEVARRVAAEFADGAWLAELAPVPDSAQVPAVIGAALGIREQSGVPTAEALARVLCAGLLAACDDVRVLATSREPLGVAGEARYRLGPLSLPGPDEAAEGAGSEAVALFADRARRVDTHFMLDGQTGPAVTRLVRRLDGMPLAIELAAARVEALGVTGLLGRLDDQFALLTSADRLAPSRQRSLAATMQWSYRLLGEEEQRVFRLVSVFPGAFTLEAAEAVAGPGAGEMVLRLVDCSLLVPPREGPDGRWRYGMLETLRAYGAGLLAGSGEQDGAASALAGYALEVAEQAAAGLQTTEGEVAAARWLDAEDAAMAQVLAWAMDHDAGIALRLAVALSPWWVRRGRLAGKYSLLRQVAGRAEPGSDGWCAAQLRLGWAAHFSDDLAGALGHATALRDAAAERGPCRELADGLTSRSGTLTAMGRSAEAADEARRALAVARELGYPAGEARALAYLSVAANGVGDYDRAVRLARQAAQITDGVPGSESRWVSYVLTGALIEAGDPAAAEPVCAVTLARSRDAGDLYNQANLLSTAVTLDLEVGRLQDAAAHLREALELRVSEILCAEVIEVSVSAGHRG